MKGILPCQLNTAVSFKPILISQLRKTHCSAFLNVGCSLCHSSARIYLSTSSQCNMLVQRRLGEQLKENPGLREALSGVFLTCCIQVSPGQATDWIRSGKAAVYWEPICTTEQAAALPRPKALPCDCSGLHLHKQELWSLISAELHCSRGQEGKYHFCPALEKAGGDGSIAPRAWGANPACRMD